MMTDGCSFCFGGVVDVGVPRWDLGHIYMLDNDQ